MGKRVYALLIVLATALVYSVSGLLFFEDTMIEEDYFSDSSAPSSQAQQITPIPIKSTQDSFQFVNSDEPKAQALDDKSPPLAYQVNVVGIKPNRADKPHDEALALIQFDQNLYEHTENELITGTTMLIEKIEQQHIVILFENHRYQIKLRGQNLLADTYREANETDEDFLAMSIEEIGTRPRIIEHLVTLTPTPYIADGKLLSPGINPALFKQAGFQEDDVLKTINGKSVTIESEFDEVKKQMRYATTLNFQVMRKGRLITLYLDIPSETLKLTP